MKYESNLVTDSEATPESLKVLDRDSKCYAEHTLAKGQQKLLILTSGHNIVRQKFFGI